MGDFKVIETQEDFDNAIKKRLEQKEREMTEHFKDYLSPEKVADLKESYEKRLKDADVFVKDAKEKLDGHNSALAELQARAEKAENSLLKNRIAHESGVPLELASRLIGDTEDDLKKDAEALASFIKPHSAPPMRSNEPTTQTNNHDAALASMLSALTQPTQ